MTARRTRAGTVTAAARKRFGNKRGKFPIFDSRSAKAALRLRGHAKTTRERASIIRRARKFAPALAARAAKTDRQR